MRMLYMHLDQNVHMYACVCVCAHLCCTDAGARGRDWRSEQLKCSEPLFTHVRPLSQAHPHRALFVHFPSLEKSDKEPWHVGRKLVVC